MHFIISWVQKTSGFHIISDTASAPTTSIYLETILSLISPDSRVQAYICINLRISCLAAPSSSHAFANSTFNFSALLLISFPFSPLHRSIVSRTSIPTASREPTGVIPFLYMGLRPSPVLTWKSSIPAWRFSMMCTAANGWSPMKG